MQFTLLLSENTRFSSDNIKKIFTLFFRTTFCFFNGTILHNSVQQVDLWNGQSGCIENHIILVIYKSRNASLTPLHSKPPQLDNPVTYFHWKIIAFNGIWTRDLPGTKPICYQLSYPGLDPDWNMDRYYFSHIITVVCMRK